MAENKCTCKDCGGGEWKVYNTHGYDYIFTCINCGESFQLISLVDLETRTMRDGKVRGW